MILNTLQAGSVYRAFNFFAEQGYSLLIEYYDSIKGRLSDSYSVIGQVWMLITRSIFFPEFVCSGIQVLFHNYIYAGSMTAKSIIK